MIILASLSKTEKKPQTESGLLLLCFGVKACSCINALSQGLGEELSNEKNFPSSGIIILLDQQCIHGPLLCMDHFKKPIYFSGLF